MRSKDIKLLHLSCWTNYVSFIFVNYLTTVSRTPGRKYLGAAWNSFWKTKLFAYVLRAFGSYHVNLVWHCIYSTPLVNKYLIKSLNIIIFWKTSQFDIHITNKMPLPNVFVSCLLKEITFYNVKVANHFHLKYLNIKATYCVRTQLQRVYLSIFIHRFSGLRYGEYWWVNLCRLYRVSHK